MLESLGFRVWLMDKILDDSTYPSHGNYAYAAAVDLG